MKNNITVLFAIGVLIFAGLACNGSFTTANISELKFGRNDTADPAVTTFNTGEDIYALAVVSNAKGKFKLNWRMTYDNVKGRDKGEEIGTKSIDFEDSKQLWQQFSSPLPGEYGVEATLTDEAGKKIDSKKATVTIKASSSSPSDDSNDKKKDEKNPDEDDS